MKKHYLKTASLVALSILLLTIPASVLTSCASVKGDTMNIDFSKKDGTLPMNLKKIDMFNPTWTFMGQADGTFDPAAINTLNGVNVLKADSFRIDMMFGNEQNGIGKPIGRNGQSGGSTNEWSLAIQFIRKCQENNISPYLVMVGTPSYATRDGDDLDFRNIPDYDRYYEFCYNTADFLKRNNIYATLETWNEPDLEGNIYWLGSTEEWIKTVVTGANAYYAANPFSSVISPGIARPLQFIQDMQNFNGTSKTAWEYFWNLSENVNAVPDGFSWHIYGPSDGDLEGDYTNADGSGNFSYQLNVIRKAFQDYSNGAVLSKVQQHLTEFHPVSNDFWGGKSVTNDTYEQVWAFYDSILRVNEASDITRVSWPMWLSTDQFGLYEGNYAINPVYHVLWTYARLPVDRVSASSSNESVNLIAGADSQRAGVIAYNRSIKKSQTVTIDWKNIPFDVDSYTVYRIDPQYYTQKLSNTVPEIVKTVNNPKATGSETIEIPVKGAYYIEFNSAAQGAELDKDNTIGTLIKKEYYYADRGDNLPFADVFNESMNVYVGMLGEDTGEAGAAVILGELESKKTLVFDYEVWGEPTAGEDSTLGVRVDYHTTDGFKQSVLMTVGGLGFNMTVPFGTEKPADSCVLMGNDLAGSYSFDLDKYAPEDWDGIIEVSYLIRNAGAGTAAKFFIR